MIYCCSKYYYIPIYNTLHYCTTANNITYNTVRTPIIANLILLFPSYTTHIKYMIATCSTRHMLCVETASHNEQSMIDCCSKYHYILVYNIPFYYTTANILYTLYYNTILLQYYSNNNIKYTYYYTTLNNIIIVLINRLSLSLIYTYHMITTCYKEERNILTGILTVSKQLNYVTSL